MISSGEQISVGGGGGADFGRGTFPVGAQISGVGCRFPRIK